MCCHRKFSLFWGSFGTYSCRSKKWYRTVVSLQSRPERRSYLGKGPKVSDPTHHHKVKESVRYKDR